MRMIDITLCENDDNDMSIILNKILPDCPDKMKTFLFSQKMALERHPNEHLTCITL